MVEFFRDERGHSALEYALLVTLFALVVVTSLQLLGARIGTAADTPFRDLAKGLS